MNCLDGMINMAYENIIFILNRKEVLKHSLGQTQNRYAGECPFLIRKGKLLRNSR